MESVDVKSENVYSQRVRAGKRTYFFDVKGHALHRGLLYYCYRKPAGRG